ncbi:hypothetical protein Q7C36_012187 [Tachysurus vachellii]|uniref:Ig-like domain-containing protein n=1 Tax=Tachysurus vachellii TaxID=175792 RepID=A0AA88MM74_TACVA|nr:hypothetical protein Q7C36_012187 [Tachysurus vachellii]
MKLLLIIFTLSCIKYSRAQIKHVHVQLSGCSESDKEFEFELDDEEILHTDFKNQAVVMKLPDFADPIQESGLYDFSVSEQEGCKQNIDIFARGYKNPPEALDAPQNSIYTSDDVQMGSENTLICHFTRFFPPPVTVRWTKNGEDVTDKSTLSQFYPNKDNTYNQFSHLSFTPQEGDIYTCTVEHKALDSPDTRTWEVNVELPSVGPSVFCGVGLFVGLLGVATGTFFLVKGNRCN